MARLTDLILEIRISFALWRLLATKCSEGQRRHAKRMAELIARRSPAQVARMEKRMGLQ